MRPFVFSCDAHLAEPEDLFSASMPAHLSDWIIHTKTDESGFRLTLMGDKVLMKMRPGLFAHKIDESVQRRGARDLKLRFEDMARDGVDAELVFPSLGLMAQRITDREAALKTAQIYNDWLWDKLEGCRDKLIGAALLPVQDLGDTLTKFKRCVAKGYAAAMLPPVLPEGPPPYNDPAWDAIFAYAGEVGVPFVFHTATGAVNIRAMKGPGGALFNYTRQMNDAVDCIAALVAGGVLDRNPKAHILFVEFGAGWLMGLAERMDESYQGHAPQVEPKLKRLPTQIVRDQVHCSFQNDTGCLVTRDQLGPHSLLFASDYPHAEGTFPYTRDVVAAMFDKVPDMTEAEKRAVLGGNAAKLFPRSHITAEPVPA